MQVEKLLSFVPDEHLNHLALNTQVNHYAKKLQGEVVFKLLLYCIISNKDNSLRSMENAYEKIAFQLLNQQYNKGKIRYSSISERLSGIKVEYFESIYKSCVEAYAAELGKNTENLIRFDSTIVALSSALLKIGYQLKGGDAENLRQLKFTVGFSEIPETVHFFHEQRYNSENVALKESIIEQAARETQTIKVFDRGITARKAYDEFTGKNIHFVTRINHTAKKDLLHSYDDTSYPVQTNSLSIISDTWGYLYMEGGKQKSIYPVRVVEAIRMADNTPITFITNIQNISAVEITEIYRRRWDIEVFFKFIKQLLNFSHLLNRSANGVKVVLYTTLVAAILLIVYKKNNSLQGFKIVKMKFENDLETAILKNIITMCGGNPELLQAILRKGP